MKTATAKELRNRAAAILDTVGKGEEVVITRRGKKVAVLKPVETIRKEFDMVGFGIWRERKDMKDVTAWVEERRKERFRR